MSNGNSVLLNNDLTNTKRPWIRHLIVLSLFILTLGLRLNYVYELEIEHPYRADALKYCKLAWNLASVGIYSQDKQPPFTPETSITPGYPFFLSLIVATSANAKQFHSKTLLLQAVISSLTVVISYLLFCRYLLPLTSILGTFLVAISPHLIIYSGYLLTETLFTFLLVLGALLYSISTERSSLSSERSSLAIGFLTGVVWGLACLTRPVLLLFPIFLLVFWTIFNRNKIKSLRVNLCVLVGLLIPWVPWHLYTHDNPQRYSPSAVSFALGGYPNLVYKTETLRGYPYKEDPRYEEMSRDLGSAAKIVLERAKETPEVFIKWYLLGKPFLYWHPNEVVGWHEAFVYKVESTSYQNHVILRKLYRFMMDSHIAFATLALIFSVFVISRSAVNKIVTDDLFLLTNTGLLLIYFTIIHMILAPLPRYSIPLYPFCYIMAIAGIQYAVTAGKKYFSERVR